MVSRRGHLRENISVSKGRFGGFGQPLEGDTQGDTQGDTAMFGGFDLALGRELEEWNISALGDGEEFVKNMAVSPCASLCVYRRVREEHGGMSGSICTCLVRLKDRSRDLSKNMSARVPCACACG